MRGLLGFYHLELNCVEIFITCLINVLCCPMLSNLKRYYRSGTVNSKSFVGKVLLQIKWKFELTVHFKHGMLGK